MHAANLQTSARLQRLCSYLADGAWHTTRDIVFDAHVMAVNAAVSELRANGLDVECRARNTGGRTVYEYRLLHAGQRELFND
ncbi:MAG: hypothetical protein F4147_12270 [Gammaproteobacteria bacterium]|nr:hypothetical protein [Gammaproteobacteria bacterium]